MGSRGVRDESGATAVLVALSLLVLFGMAAVAVDLGSAWKTKRDMVPDTDAAALAAAPTVLGTCQASALAAARVDALYFLEANLGHPADASRFEFTVDCNTGAVTVGYTQDAQTTFAPAIGVSSIPVFASSTAAADFTGGGLRPFSVCMNDPEIQAWLEGDGNKDGQGAADEDGIPDVHPVQRLDYEKSWDSNSDDPLVTCGGAPGNWGFVCYSKTFGTDNQCSNDEETGIQAMVLGGYPGTVDLGDPGATPPDLADCDPDTAALDDCDGKTGVMGGSLKNELNVIKCEAQDPADCRFKFPILGMDAYTGEPSPGTNAELHPTAFIGVVLRDFFVTGSGPGRFLEFELVNLFKSGTSSMITSNTLDRLPPRLCGIDHAPQDYC